MARVTLTSGTDPRLRRLELHFARRRLISVRVRYRHGSRARAERHKAACRGMQIVDRSSFWYTCRDGFTTMWTAYPTGRRVTLLDLEGAIAAGMMTRSAITAPSESVDLRGSTPAH